MQGQHQTKLVVLLRPCPKTISTQEFEPTNCLLASKPYLRSMGNGKVLAQVYWVMVTHKPPSKSFARLEPKQLGEREHGNLITSDLLDAGTAVPLAGNPKKALKVF